MSITMTLEVDGQLSSDEIVSLLKTCGAREIQIDQDYLSGNFESSNVFRHEIAIKK